MARPRIYSVQSTGFDDGVKDGAGFVLGNPADVSAI